MGSGRWSTDVYAAAADYRRATGASAFAYSDGGATTVHPDLDPHGVTVRESRDSDEHPESLAIAVLFDVTGSMGTVPRTLQTRLPDLMGLLLRKGYVAHPQILFGAVGDATCDRAPLQIGQFESDNRMDDDLGKILLEGGGGGQMTESYELAMYFMARHTSIDCLERRGKRGYLFMIGDELAYPKVKRAEVAEVIGADPGRDVPVAEILGELRGKYDVYFIIPEGGYHSGDARLRDFWRGLLGQNVLYLDDLDAVCETIALTVGLGEGAIDLAEGLAHLDEVGSTAGPSVSRALARLDASRAPAAVSSAPADLGSGPSRHTRL
ncbi:hypothetical protein Arub01_31650 [Actinomadura rubrobrunea]|uniref:VWA domain-containing protein n=1 Tax=Actinomadura rubrobrunea TaxID=115335 RepID=A0A9W6UUR7_9ACTN|nr:hypothetical protein [Actinomadura rubrobrunea]GLW64921.1 hypothetical protein Arub01_31650 [Actinomadura rubrobrunea]